MSAIMPIFHQAVRLRCLAKSILLLSYIITAKFYYYSIIIIFKKYQFVFLLYHFNLYVSIVSIKPAPGTKNVGRLLLYRTQWMWFSFKVQLKTVLHVSDLNEHSPLQFKSEYVVNVVYGENREMWFMFARTSLC